MHSANRLSSPLSSVSSLEADARMRRAAAAARRRATSPSASPQQQRPPAGDAASMSATSDAGTPLDGCKRPSPLQYLQGRWAVGGDGAGRMVATYGRSDGWLRLMPEVQLNAAWSEPTDDELVVADPKAYTRALYVTWSAAENCLVRLGPAMDASYVLTRCPGWTNNQLVWEGFAYNDHGVAKKAVRTIYEDLGDDAMAIVEQVRGAEDFETVASFRLRRESPLRALNFFGGIWDVKGYSEDAAGRPGLFQARLTSDTRDDVTTLTIDGSLGEQPYHGKFEQGYDEERGLYFNRCAQSTADAGTGWSRGWEGDHFDWSVTLAASDAQPARRLHIERRRLGQDRFEITERIHDGNTWRTFGQKTATRVAA